MGYSQTNFSNDSIVKVEDWFHEAKNHHEPSIRNLLEKRNLIIFQAELVREWKVGIGSSNDTVVVHNNDVFVGYLRLSILEDTISI